MTQKSDVNDNIALELLEVQRTLGWMDLVIGSISDAVYVADRNGRIIFANQFFANVVGVERVFLLGRVLDEVFPALQLDVRIAEYDTSQNLSLLPGNKHSGIYSWTDKDDKDYVFRVSYRLLQPTDQTVYLAQDITREYGMSKMKNSFIDLASHQLRTPMTAIMTYAHLLRDGFAGELTPDQLKLSTTLVESSERMIKLVNDLLAITRLQNGTDERSPLYVPINDIFSRLRAEVQHRMSDKDLQFSTEASVGAAKYTVNEPVLLEVISNLVVNAIQYTPAKGSVAVRARLSRGNLVMTVKDTGIGVPKNYIPDMFSQFSRGENALSAYPEGTGLGLYMIKILLDKVKGTITCDSKLGEGTTFTVRIPLNSITDRTAAVTPV